MGSWVSSRPGIRNEKLSGASFLILTPNSTPVMYIITSASLHVCLHLSSLLRRVFCSLWIWYKTIHSSHIYISVQMTSRSYQHLRLPIPNLCERESECYSNYIIEVMSYWINLASGPHLQDKVTLRAGIRDCSLGRCTKGDLQKL